MEAALLTSGATASTEGRAGRQEGLEFGVRGSGFGVWEGAASRSPFAVHRSPFGDTDRSSEARFGVLNSEFCLLSSVFCLLYSAFRLPLESWLQRTYALVEEFLDGCELFSQAHRLVILWSPLEALCAHLRALAPESAVERLFN